MPRLVTKFKYLKPGTGGRSVGGYARYIATREGAERIDDSHRHAPATQKQQALIEKILRDFPDTKQSHEYRDYQQERTVGNASEFISMAMEENLNAVVNTKTYADYIATRPRAERFGSHGLFTDDGVEVQLSEVSKELNAYRGNVYTAILSLKREDAARLGFDHGSRWRDFLRGQTPTLSENLKIPMNHLRWYAAFHNEGHHPHVHLIAYSTVPGEGHLSAKGVEKMRSVFAREIFSQELMFTYQQQTEYRDRLREQGRERVSEIAAKINAGEYLNPRIGELLVQLSDRLSCTTGKKVYGYLKSDARGSDAEIAGAMRELEQALANGEKKSVQDDPDKEKELTPTGEAGNHTRTGSILVTDGGNLTEDKLHFSVAENFSKEEEVLQFAPIEENCIRLIRDGKVYPIGIPEKKSLVVSGGNAYLSLMNLQLNELLQRNCLVGAAAAFLGQRELTIHGTGCAESTKNPILCAKCLLCLKMKSKRRSRDYITTLNTTLQCWTFMRSI